MFSSRPKLDENEIFFLQAGNPGIDITALVEDAILNAEDAVAGLDLRVQIVEAYIALELGQFAQNLNKPWTAVVEVAILNFEDAVALDLRVQTADATILNDSELILH